MSKKPSGVTNGAKSGAPGVSMRVILNVVVLLACVLWVPGTARAQGSMLHGIGPVNSSMGGAGVALFQESLGALTFNPALITSVQGNQVSFSTEFFQDRPRIDLTVGGRTGRTKPTIQLGVIPAFGWIARDPSKKVAMGFGLIGLAGFRTDYPQDTASILFSPPPGGYGRVYTDYSLTKIPFAVAFEATPKFSLGVSFILYRGTLAIAPLPAATFDIDPAGNKFYPGGGNVIAHFGVGGQLGLAYKVNDMVTVGANYSSPVHFDDFTWNSTFADPGSPRYGQARKLPFTLNGPGQIGFGVGVSPNPKVKVAVDGMWTQYTNVGGFGGKGGIVGDTLATRTVRPFGWQNIWTFKTGVQFEATPMLSVRGGFNYSQVAIRKEIVLASTGTPATFQKHFTGGIGMKLMPHVTADASFYVVPREHVIGPLLDPNTNFVGGVVPNSKYDMSNSLTSVLIGFNFSF